ncbi:peptidase [Nocardia cyriacigeorgica]|uniref:Peptidase n=1 Tax=Nocardia cyriacigeorgica TaxID=135487 RepID=A0A6P1D3A7_9NOCA|nr:peptidase [Nocardia cyriacigeorgica]NEW44009.1 peptidase [Nocardia cyriacigeorgica]NEW51028.1 peptidase [Nocardia cyriacigeorgica]NEW54388.1 peptidase [Nocardia cyriacigeorgica]
MYRALTLAAFVLLAVASCGDETKNLADAPSRPAMPAPVIPAPPPEFWSAPAVTPQQHATVAQATRQIDVCSLIPRDTLDDLGNVESVTVGLDSCRSIIGIDAREDSTLTWHATLLPELTPGRGISKQLGDVSIRLIPDRDDGPPRACGATARFPSGAAFYLGLSTPGQDPCAVADGLLPGMIDRWRQSPPQGTSPDTVSTVLLGADPCAVRAILAGTADTDQRRLTQCLFRYRDETVTVGYDYRVPTHVAANSIEEKFDNRTVHRSVSLYDSSIPIFTAVVGPELPPDSTMFGTRVPIVEVSAANDGVAREVMSRVLTLFPQ